LIRRHRKKVKAARLEEVFDAFGPFTKIVGKHFTTVFQVCDRLDELARIAADAENHRIDHAVQPFVAVAVAPFENDRAGKLLRVKPAG
jgi:hypothetical protein